MRAIACCTSAQPPEPQRIIADHVDKDLVAMLYGVVTSGTGRSAAIPGHEAAGKTGTTQDYHDAWFVGFTADYVASVWVGNDNSSPMKGVTGGTLPATIWHEVMVAAEDGLKSTPLDKSSPQAPVEDTTEYDSGLTEAPATTSTPDDESGGGSASAENEPHQQIPAGERRNFFDWLFGSGRSSHTPPPPPPPPPSPQSGDSDGENDSN